MFSGIANYFFGSSEAQETGETPREKSPSPTRGCNLKISAADEEWLLVDKSSRPGSKEVALDVRLEGAQDALTCNVMSRSSDSSSDISTLADNTSESWLVTPPPCFTGGQKGVEVGSMENLLIEHPSMSVYGPRGRQGSSGVESDRESMSDIEEGKVAKFTPREVHRATRRSGRALSLRENLTPQQIITKASHAAQRKSNRHINRSQLQRNNKLPRHNNKRHDARLQQPNSRKQAVTSRH